MKGEGKSGSRALEKKRAKINRKDKKADATKKARRHLLQALPAPDNMGLGSGSGFVSIHANHPHDTTLLDISRIQWQHGDWATLAELSIDTIGQHKERARLALIVAASHGQLGNLREARRFAAHALTWGCSHTVAAQILISSAYNTLARAATCLQDASASSHFTSALKMVEPSSDLPLLSRSRQIRETTRLGLLPEAADLIAVDLAEVAKIPGDNVARLSALDQRLMQLKQELSLSLARGQLFAGPTGGAGPETAQDRDSLPEHDL